MKIPNLIPGYAASDCELQRQGPSPEWAKPKCNPDGSYKIYQCDPYSRTVCWCVYPNGQMVPGARFLIPLLLQQQEVAAAMARTCQ